MSEKNDGGPAFPRESKWADYGMSLRQWYAGQALVGMLASAPVVDRSKVDKGKWAAIAFDWADEMIKADEVSKSE